MIRPRLVFSGALLSAALLLAACSTSSLSRIDADRELYESWPLDVQEAVLEQRVINDMTPEQVEMAVGKPTEKTVRSGRQGSEEVWIYREKTGPNLGNMSIGGSIGPVGVVQQGGGGYAEENEVVFMDGRVVRTTLPQ